MTYFKIELANFFYFFFSIQVSFQCGGNFCSNVIFHMETYSKKRDQLFREVLLINTAFGLLNKCISINIRRLTKLSCRDERTEVGSKNKCVEDTRRPWGFSEGSFRDLPGKR